MTTSPYDNLPVGSQLSTSRPQENQLQYVDVNLESAEEASADLITNQMPAPEADPGRSVSAHSIQPNKPAPAFAKPDNAAHLAEPASVSMQSKQPLQPGQPANPVQATEQTPVSTQASEPIPASSKTADTEQPDEPVSSSAQPGDQAPASTQPGETAAAFAKPSSTANLNEQAPDSMQAAKRQQPSNLATSSAPAQPVIPVQPAFAKTTPFDKAPKYDKRSIKNIWGQQEYILPFEESLLVPDTMPDMDHILFAEGRADLTQPAKSSYEKSDFVSGDITLYTVYKPEPNADSPVDVVKSSIAFKTDKCWDKAEGDDFRVTVAIKNISAEMINERKFTARGQLLITFTEIAKKELMVFSGTDDPDLVQSDGYICVTGLDFETDETTEISQEINCREEQPAPVKILKESIRIVENHRQITSGKLVINASIHSQILYLGEKEGEQKLSCTINKTDFTQFIMVDDSADTDRMKITFHSGNLKAKIESQNKFLLHGQVTTLIQGYKNQEIPIVADAYHKNSEIKFDINAQALSSINDTVTGEISAREVIAPGETEKKPETLLCGSCHIASIQGQLERDKVIIEGTMPVKILALNEENTPFLIENSIPLRGSLEMPSITEDVTLCISSALKEFWFDEINSHQMEINASISLKIWALGKETFKTIENLCFAETKEPARRISMALYVVGSGDTLWDVAKKYKSDMNMLAELNQIDPQKPLSEGMKLLVAK